MNFCFGIDRIFKTTIELEISSKLMIKTKVLTHFLYEFTVSADEIDASVEKKYHNFSSTYPFELILVSNIFFDILLLILKQKYPEFVV